MKKHSLIEVFTVLVGFSLPSAIAMTCSHLTMQGTGLDPDNGHSPGYIEKPDRNCPDQR